MRTPTGRVEDINTAGSRETHDYAFLAIIELDVDDLGFWQKSFLDAVSHIPKYWSVGERGRELYASLMSEPKIHGGVAMFEQTFALTLAEAAEFEALLACKMNGNKSYLLQNTDGDNKKFDCRFTDGGLREFCEIRYEQYRAHSGAPSVRALRPAGGCR